MKILVVGSLNGNVEKAMSKLKSMHQKHQFDLILCTGDLIPLDISWILQQSLAMPIPLYFIQGKYPLDAQIQSMIDSSEGLIGPNIIFLGSHGVLQTATGTTIAYMGGTEGAYKDLSMTPFDRFSKVDILLTYDWPLGIDAGSDLYQQKFKEASTGNSQISELSSRIQPRYHFACSNGSFFEREPYRNLQDHRILTRFIGLGHFGNTAKERWFYAFTLNSATTTVASTVSPFVTAGIVKPKPKRAVSPDGSFFWNDSATKQFKSNQVEKARFCKICKVNNCLHLQQRAIPEGYLCRICGNPGHHIKDCPHGYSANSKKKRR
jgi:hypothetical protein